MSGSDVVDSRVFMFQPIVPSSFRSNSNGGGSGGSFVRNDDRVGDCAGSGGRASQTLGDAECAGLSDGVYGVPESFPADGGSTGELDFGPAGRGGIGSRAQPSFDATDAQWDAWWNGVFVSQRVLLLLVSFAWMLLLGSVLVVALYANVFTFHKYTYWNLCLTVASMLWLFLGVLVEGGVLKAALIFIYPVVTCSNFLVTVIINVILASNGFLLVEGTEFGIGRSSLGAVHLGDTLVHPAPLFALLFCLSSGLLGYGRAVIGDYFHVELSCLGKLKFVAYWYVSPLLLLAMYGSIFDPLAEYPTSLSVWNWGVLIVCLAFAFQTLNLLWMLCPSGNKLCVPIYRRWTVDCTGRQYRCGVDRGIGVGNKLLRVAGSIDGVTGFSDALGGKHHAVSAKHDTGGIIQVPFTAAPQKTD